MCSEDTSLSVQREQMPAAQLCLSSRASANRAPFTDGSIGWVLAALCPCMFPSSGDLPDPRIKPATPALGGRFLLLSNFLNIINLFFLIGRKKIRMLSFPLIFSTF